MNCRTSNSPRDSEDIPARRGWRGAVVRNTRVETIFFCNDWNNHLGSRGVSSPPLRNSRGTRCRTKSNVLDFSDRVDEHREASAVNSVRPGALPLSERSDAFLAAGFTSAGECLGFFGVWCRVRRRSQESYGEILDFGASWPRDLFPRVTDIASTHSAVSFLSPRGVPVVKRLRRFRETTG